MSILKRLVNAVNYSNKRKILLYLQAMTTSQLVEYGFSPALVEKGINAWPWRNDNLPDGLVKVKKLIADEQHSINELQRFTDAELADIGISRTTIRQSVRHGRAGIDYLADEKAA